MGPQLPVLPVYLIHWNAPSWAASAARTILASEGLQVELTIIDNPSQQTQELAPLLPSNVRVLYAERNLGYAGGANIALREWNKRSGPHDLCVLCAHDLHVCPDTFKVMRDQLGQSPEYGVLEPTIWSQKPQGYYPSSSPILEVEWATGCCLMLRHSALAGILFDESFQSYVEDVDFCLRVRDAGYKIGMATRAVAWELGSISSTAAASVKANQLRLRMKRGGLIAGLVGVGYLLINLLRHFLGSYAFWRGPTPREASRKEARASVKALAKIAVPSFWVPPSSA
jgi:GT2 family glycosyltransferase